MEFAQIELVQIPDGNGGSQVVLAVKGTPVVGVETVSFGGDSEGSFMDVRFRAFHLGSSMEEGAETIEVEEGAETIEDSPPDKIGPERKAGA